jgi:hypothetical protein
VSAAYPFDGPHIVGLLGAEIAGMLGLDLAIGFLSSLAFSRALT